MKQQTWRYLAACSTAFAAMALSFSASAGIPTFKEVPAQRGDSDFCVGKDDGTYEHPDCRVRYSCKRGMASQVTCPEGQVFDPSKNPDDNPTLSYCSAPETMKHVDCSGVRLGEVGLGGELAGRRAAPSAAPGTAQSAGTASLAALAAALAVFACAPILRSRNASSRVYSSIRLASS